MTKRPAMKLTTVRLDDGMRDALKKAAESEGTKYQPLLRKILREWLKTWFERHLDTLK
jgi:hypothetical protein